MLPSIDAATARVLHAIGVQALIAPRAGCCGAIRQHLGDQPGALTDMRRNIDAWWPYIERGTAEAIVINASGCAVSVKEYGYLLREDPAYADKARRISQCARDLCEFLLPEVQALRTRLRAAPSERLAVQIPCTLQHGQQLSVALQQLLSALGIQPLPAPEAHTLRDRKLQNLLTGGPTMILSANIGCIGHLATGTTLPVWHWIEWLDRALAPAASYV
jgi:glycolate oxidase iron-sulfur subunit